jgi:Double-GTPase 2
MQELKITMLGPSGVGKTTLLAAIYEQFENNIGITNLQLTPDDESTAILQDRLVELKSLLDVFEARGRVGIQGTEAMAGPKSLRSFTFGLGKKGETPSLWLHFYDYPGGYHETKASPEEKEFVKINLRDSAAVLIAIDAPALMEKKGRFHEKINRPQQIKALFNAAYQDLESPRLVIFAPVKCEKYLNDPKSTKELLNRIEQGYINLFNHFNSEKLSPWIACAITPVQTVGSVVFSRLEVDTNNNPHFYFRKIKHDAEYNPKDSEQPLRYLLRFLLKIHLEGRNWGIFNFIRDWLRLDSHLKKAIDEFARGCKTNGSFAIIKGEKWLNI